VLGIASPMTGSLLAGRRETALTLWALGALLTIAVATGGSSHPVDAGPPLAPLLALPLIGWAVHRLLGEPQLAVSTRVWIALALLLIALPLLQWLSLPGHPAGAVAGRAALEADLERMGVAASIRRISLSPWNTLAAACALLPALAIFLLCLAAPQGLHRRLPWLLIALALLSLLLGIVQLGLPADHALNPFPQWRPALGGFFANPNHQATLLVIGATLAAGRLAAALDPQAASGHRRSARAYVPALALLLTACAVPLTGSRAGVILLMLSLGATAVCLWPAGRGRRASATAAGIGAIVLIGGLVALRWMGLDAIGDLRGPLRAATLEVAARFAPTGSGIGSFVRVFEQEAPRELLMRDYVNHAHNEYLQWWLEAGVPALVAMALAAVALALTARGLALRRAAQRADGVAALIALLAILAHSTVDYPLRTPALLAVAAALAGMAAAEAAGGSGRSQRRAIPA
jgi:O-antigen ligase